MDARFVVFTVILVFSALSMISLNLSTKASPSVIRVPQDYPTIQIAVDAASPGDTILVDSGIYYEHVYIDYNKYGIFLIGENRTTTIIDGSGKGTVIYAENTHHVFIRGFTVRNGTIGIEVFGSDDNIIQDNKITLNSHGIALQYSSNSTLKHNIMLDNEYNFRVHGTSLSDFIHDIDTSNTVNGEPIHYLINQNTMIIDPFTFPNIGYLALINSTNISVKDLNFAENGQGLLFAYSSNSFITNVSASNNYYGIYLLRSSNITMANNAMIDNIYSFGVVGEALFDYVHDIDTSNTINGKPIYYWINQHHRVVPPDADYVAVVNSTNITVRDLNLTGSVHGVLFAYSSHSNLTNLSASSNVWGVRLWESNNIAVHNGSFTHNKYGISLSYSNANTLAYNIVSNNSYIGVRCTYSSNNTLNHNEISSNSRWGLSFHDSDWNIVVDNTIRDNVFPFISWGGGFGLENGYGNIVYHNNFIHNSPHEAIEYNGGGNSWDNGVEGNYWSDYTGRDLNGDGIGDEHLPCHGDYFPLINPYILGDVNHDAKVNIYDIVLAAGAYGSTPSDPNWNPHCDIAEPYGIINVFDIVMIAGNYGKAW